MSDACNTWEGATHATVGLSRPLEWIALYVCHPPLAICSSCINLPKVSAVLFLFHLPCTSLPENVVKNRFRNALPPDHTRVSLHDVDVGRAGADYVNANFVDGVDRPRCYIAAQVGHW